MGYAKLSGIQLLLIHLAYLNRNIYFFTHYRVKDKLKLSKYVKSLRILTDIHSRITCQYMGITSPVISLSYIVVIHQYFSPYYMYICT